jgi:cytochrome P450 family 4
MCVREKELLKILHDFTDGVIQKRSDDLMKKQNETTVSNEVNDDIGRKKKMALLDILLSSTIDGKPLSNFDIREEIDTFMFAGHDTTTCAISFTFHLIAKYPEVQQKVYDEIVEVMGENGDELTIPKLNNLSYLDLVIKESLRMYPPVPYYGRKLAEDLTVQGYTFPKDMNIYVSPFLMGRSEEYYEDPLTFKPERFNTETTYDKINPFAFVPFSAGPRYEI